MRPLKNKTISDTNWRVQLVCMQVEAHSSLEAPLECNQEQMPLMNQGSMTFLTILGVMEILCKFNLVLLGENRERNRYHSHQITD